MEEHKDNSEKLQKSFDFFGQDLSNNIACFLGISNF